ncbi:hypothetical protein Fleli_2788 [Bernardetia litoralis DSM 6794]|uniref:Uncharacterized protein n=1 Tax=Bernardetia litoralis (strain ATCC 23117 / DSM 6794 / NBRC 15988 / NCIMB 1366 / Fx l1 / Sio-4) TaxID=880071 RepID=I4AMF6_BERLS|nr:hypothetical protein [Bernardetia litoralis]AFM05141.1 hypothetical protein Fleli_2788 [Bernardetia litoralis DSM 6794]
MKKIIFLSFFFISFSSISFAQNKKADALKDKMAQEICDCINESGVDLDNEEDIKLKLGVCMMQSIGESQKQLNKVGININNEDDVSSFAEDLGMIMATKCPAVFMKFAENEADEDSNGEEIITHTLTGTILEVKEGAFVTLIIKDEEGRSHNVLWLEFFENADEVKENYSKLKNMSVSVEYYEKEYYNPKIEDYVKVKVLKKVGFE